ncbi:putative carnitine O-palmitoyltransferase 2, mitochondrial [Apostichopus japonicus]|uniref:Putative carnitine O-palmitoyltransferase 2, mitochondrial n=1 Tax=Stichopus japonicus TaxID=307972 RepID=A0A2G8JWF5_STIJA|nr:putative carnitine O-palmitoyltransferase 2, mitochondrial [Apostichopus japonicus]
MLKVRNAYQKLSVSKGKTVTAAYQVLRKHRNENHVTANHYSTNDSDYLQDSIIPTMHFQAGLPRLPVPKLEDTCKRYLASQKPILSDDAYAQTAKLVKDFEAKEGKDLQKQLKAQDKQNKHTSYISGPWFDMYLKDRRPIVLNQNPFVAFKNDERAEYNEPVLRAANMTVAAMRFAKTMRASKLAPEIYHLNAEKSDTERFRKIARLIPSRFAAYYAILNKAFPLDMSQYFRLLNSTRIPLVEKDEFYTVPTARHLVVMKNGNFYAFDVYDKDGNILPGSEIYAHLKYIYQDATPRPEHPVGYLTSEERTTWARLRKHIVDLSENNKQAMDVIDTAAFCLCFDDTAPTDEIELCRAYLYGDGANRWFDKSFQLLLAKNGLMSINFEHAWGDGVAVLRFFNETFKLTTENPPISAGSSPAAVDSSSAVKLLNFNLDDTVKDGINSAIKRYTEQTSRLSMQALKYDKYGKNLLKKGGVSPDGVMQLSFQMAHFQQSGGKVAPTYESCSTAAFKHGRTETIRPATVETLRASQAFASGSSVSNEEKKKLLKDCSNRHNQLTKEAAMGQGWDRHLFALRTLAEQSGTKPGIFSDPAYINICQIVLSTSSIFSPAVLAGGFAPVIPSGYGIGYYPEEDTMMMGVTTYPESSSGSDFIECVRNSWDQIHEVLTAAKD